jgi:hypothetical protein
MREREKVAAANAAALLVELEVEEQKASGAPSTFLS